MKAYKLLKNIPGMNAGAIFLHDKKDNIKGSIGVGCLKNAWVNGDCQGTKHDQWCAATHVFPGQLADDRKWFKPVKTEKVKYVNNFNKDEYSL